MADLLHVEVLRVGSLFWNSWRRENPDVVPDLRDLKVSISERQFGRMQGGPIDLSRAQLCRAELDQATLIEANLNGAVLTDADLSCARLERADLRGADLCNAKLAYTTLNGAQLEAANLCGANLRHARGLTQSQINRALGDRWTTLPGNLNMPSAWQPHPVQLGRVDTEMDLWVSAHAILGVSPGASTQEVRAAWLKLVKELHPEGWSSLNSPASERLKAINQAYQTLKSPERYTTQRRDARGFFHNARAIFAASFLLSIIAGALFVGVRTYLSHRDNAFRKAASVAGTTLEQNVPRAFTAPPSVSYAPSGQPSPDEPFVGADWRLR
jgi:1,6-anhydro-N-acetylmuramate kinase